MGEWQPIAEHVGPEMRVLVSDGRYVEVAEVWADENGEYRVWCDEAGRKIHPEPTHFQPLPPAPAVTAGEEE